jgi:hypothetical protein
VSREEQRRAQLRSAVGPRRRGRTPRWKVERGYGGWYEVRHPNDSSLVEGRFSTREQADARARCLNGEA